MKKIILLLFASFMVHTLFAQRDTVIFLYKCHMYAPLDVSTNKGVTKVVNCNNGDVLFRIAGTNMVSHTLMYSNILSEKMFVTPKQLQAYKRVYNLDYLSTLDDKGFIDTLGLIGVENDRKHVAVFLVPLLDMGAYRGPAYEILFVSEFLERGQ